VSARSGGSGDSSSGGMPGLPPAAPPEPDSKPDSKKRDSGLLRRFFGQGGG
jgi:hypothetical protein